MENTNNLSIIQYVPFRSFVHPSFWHTLTEHKLNIDKLNSTTKQIFGKYCFRDDIGPLFEVSGTSFNSEPESEQFYFNVTGTILNKNTIEDFKSIDKTLLLNSFGEAIWANIKNKSWIDKPNLLLNFFILSFADLKKFHYYYWFAFPSPSQPTVYVTESKQISQCFTKEEITQIFQKHMALDENQKQFFIVVHDSDINVYKLSRMLFPNEVKIRKYLDLNNTYFAYVDPSNEPNPGWVLRLYLAGILDHCTDIQNCHIKVLGLRFSPNYNIDNSYVYTLKIPETVQTSESAGWVGWERNDKGNFGPKLANMSASMDPIKIADSSSDLNIKLMKWRLVPDLNFNVMKNTKCLLLGAGTLGCHVARDLLAWGFRHITFIDNGKVSFSNPTRQVLFNFQDCLNGGKNKAEAAAENLKLILPTVETKGIPLHIPMPGHPVGESLKQETVNNIKTLTELIQEHDVVFLLLDTREARWLPTLISNYHGKIVINAALGFDSYLVMRHGVNSIDIEGSTSTFIKGSQLGCYFCNDVTAPGNSLKDRTLDQQCTVTRPGVAAIAGALAVEVLVGLLQHPLRVDAPAAYNLKDDSEIPLELQGVLGPIPHSIRGFLHSYQNVIPTCAKFKQCIGCSDAVIQRYKNDGIDFILKACESGKYLEEVTGLLELQLSAEMTDVMSFSDEDDEEEN